MLWCEDCIVEFYLMKGGVMIFVGVFVCFDVVGWVIFGVMVVGLIVFGCVEG